jgi:hypothetical protein
MVLPVVLVVPGPSAASAASGIATRAVKASVLIPKFLSTSLLDVDGSLAEALD